MLQVVQKFDGPYLRVEGYTTPLLNMANFDFLGFGQRKELKAAAVQALDKVCRGVFEGGVGGILDYIRSFYKLCRGSGPKPRRRASLIGGHLTSACWFLGGPRSSVACREYLRWWAGCSDE